MQITKITVGDLTIENWGASIRITEKDGTSVYLWKPQAEEVIKAINLLVENNK